jgi:branched-chain amino acid transport system ATP-binding protein
VQNTKAITVEGVFKYYGGLCVLNDLYMDVEFGELKAVIGPNGAGKTTLFNVIGGETPATDGQIHICGKNATKLSVNQRAELGLGRIFQINTLFLHMSVLENIILSVQSGQGSLRRMLRPIEKYTDVLLEAEKILQTLDLWDKRDVEARSLSYGEQRRLEIGLGLASKPKVLLMDEPTAGLSASECAFLKNLLQEVKRNTTIVLVAHDIDFVLDIADRIIVMNFGVIIIEGTREEIEGDKAVREIYIGA